MKIRILAIYLTFTIACSINSSGSNKTTPAPSEGSPVTEQRQPNETNKDQQVTVTTGPESIKNSAVDSCPAVKRPGKRQIKSQTFPFNYPPFTDMCFVTFASLEQMLDEKDVPRGSTFHLYQNGNSVLDLPDAFDGQEACWVEGVSFKDLNEDGFTDIIIAGNCLGARDSYPSNAIFVNNGEDFTTKAQANQKLENLTKLSQIEAYVKRNRKLFF